MKILVLFFTGKPSSITQIGDENILLLKIVPEGMPPDPLHKCEAVGLWSQSFNRCLLDGRVSTFLTINSCGISTFLPIFFGRPSLFLDFRNAFALAVLHSKFHTAPHLSIFAFWDCLTIFFLCPAGNSWISVPHPSLPFPIYPSISVL